MRPILVGLLMFILNLGCSSQPEMPQSSPSVNECKDDDCCSQTTRSNILKQSLARKAKDNVEGK